MTFQEEINETSWKAKIIFSLFLSIEAIFFASKLLWMRKLFMLSLQLSPFSGALAERVQLDLSEVGSFEI